MFTVFANFQFLLLVRHFKHFWMVRIKEGRGGGLTFLFLDFDDFSYLEMVFIMLRG